MKQAVHVFYSGSVQGVGFRYTAREIASEAGVTGWVRNLWDGRVEIVAEGEETALKDFLSRVGDYFSGSISKAELSWEPPAGGFSDFTVKI
jgi:acylphosphatase